VTWLGDVSDFELASLYRGARCLVYASLYEGFGIPVAEALACGCPIVTSRGSAMEEVAGEDATYVDPTDAESIRDGIRRAVAPAPRRIASWDDVAARTRAVYEELA
jgi:glycosyltransferase involved in cell wall biosynthesis